MKKEHVINEFHKEFGPIKYLFDIKHIKSPKIGQKPESIDWVQPGVYVYLYNDEQIIKVGKSNVNSFKRSLEHMRDGTTQKNGGVNMSSFSGNSNVEILYINITDPTLSHWVVALEDFLEKRLEPVIPSVRRT